uniref:Uncharacterized protein n=1 Tax=Arundo donax TaxID=35708 RepID=A0A0A9CH94_ARUDO
MSSWFSACGGLASEDVVEDIRIAPEEDDPAPLVAASTVLPIFCLPVVVEDAGVEPLIEDWTTGLELAMEFAASPKAVVEGDSGVRSPEDGLMSGLELLVRTASTIGVEVEP